MERVRRHRGVRGVRRLIAQPEGAASTSVMAPEFSMRNDETLIITASRLLGPSLTTIAVLHHGVNGFIHCRLRGHEE